MTVKQKTVWFWNLSEDGKYIKIKMLWDNKIYLLYKIDQEKLETYKSTHVLIESRVNLYDEDDDNKF